MPTSGACPVSSGRASSCDSVSTSPSNGSRDRKSTRLNSSHITNSYAVFCSKKKMLHHRPLLAHFQPPQPAVPDAEVQREHLRLFELLLRTLLYIDEQLLIAAGVGYLLHDVD